MLIGTSLTFTFFGQYSSYEGFSSLVGGGLIHTFDFFFNDGSHMTVFMTSGVWLYLTCDVYGDFHSSYITLCPSSSSLEVYPSCISWIMNDNDVMLVCIAFFWFKNWCSNSSLAVGHESLSLINIQRTKSLKTSEWWVPSRLGGGPCCIAFITS